MPTFTLESFTFINIISAIYAAGGVITFLGFIPTMIDLWKKHPSANITTYIVWTLTTLATSLYAILVVQDLLFSVVINLQLAACFIILIMRVRLKLVSAA